MKIAAILTFLALALALSAADPRVLAAIREVEAVRDPARRGPAEELGFYRFTPAAWVQHTTVPFARCATDPDLELRIAAAHLDWLAAGLRRARLIRADSSAKTRAFYLALAWNAGLAATLRGHTPAPARDYAQRVANLATTNQPNP